MKWLESSQNHYRRKYDKGLHLGTEEIFQGHYFFLRSEKKDEEDHRHKLAPIAEGVYVVKSVDNTQALSLSSEKTRHSRMFLAPYEVTANEHCKNTPQIYMSEGIIDCPGSEAEKRTQIRPPPPTEVFNSAIQSQGL